jgi:hypothetical protein
LTIINDKEEKLTFDDEKDVYFYEVDCLSRNILEGKKEPDFPGMTIEDSLVNMSIIQEWLK